MIFQPTRHFWFTIWYTIDKSRLEAFFGTHCVGIVLQPLSPSDLVNELTASNHQPLIAIYNSKNGQRTDDSPAQCY